MSKTILTSLLVCLLSECYAQSARLALELRQGNNAPVAGAFIRLLNTSYEGYTEENGRLFFHDIVPGIYAVEVKSTGFVASASFVTVKEGEENIFVIQLVEQATQLENVVVTARKKEEAVQSLPISMSVLNAAAVEDYRLWRAKDLSGIVPNLYAANPGDGRNVIAIRGLTSTSYDPAVATYIDGVSQFSLDTYIPLLFDIERIEVLRGPQGTLYGRNAMGGVINVISKAPSNRAECFAEISYGNYASSRYVAGARLPLVKDKLFLGAAGLHEATDGYYRNVFNQSPFDTRRSYGGGITMQYLPAERWRVSLNVKHLASRNDGAFPLAGSPAYAFASPFTVDQDAIAKLVDNTLNASLSIQHYGRKLNITSQTAYQSNYRYYDSPIDGDFSPADAITIINDYGSKWNKVKVLTQELRLNTTNLLSRWKWTGGLFLFYQQAPVKQATHFGKDAALVGSPDIDFSIIGTSRNRNSGFAGYLRTDYAIRPGLQLAAGMRYDYQRTRSSVLGEYLPDGAVSPVFETRPDTMARTNYGAVSPALSLSWQASNDHLFYASYSRGFRTGGLTQFSSDPSQPALFSYKPEYSNTFELGAKNMFQNNSVRFNLALFYSNINNAQVPTLVLPDAITVTRNAGKLTSKGVEAELAAIPFKGLELTANIGYTHARYKQLQLATGGQQVDLKGSKQIFTPDISSSMVVQYSVKLDRTNLWKLVTRMEWYYIGTTYFDFGNTIRQSPYHLVHARAGVSFGEISLMGWVRNIGDEKYISYAYDFGATHFGEPLMFGVTLRMDYKVKRQMQVKSQK